MTDQLLRPRGLRALPALVRSSLFARLVTSFVGLSLVTVLLVSTAAYLRARAMLRSSILERLQAVAIVKEDQLNRWVDEQHADLVYVASLPGLRDLAATLAAAPAGLPAPRAFADLTARLDSARTYALDMEEVFVLSAAGGRVIASTDRARVGDYRTSELFFLRGREATFVQNVYPSPMTGRPTLTVATPLRDATGRVVAVLAGNLNLTRIDHILADRSGLRATGEAYLVTRLSDFVSATRFGRAGARRGIHTDGVWHALSGLSGAGVYNNYLDVPVLGVYRWIAPRQLALMVEMHAAEAFAPANQLFLTMLSVGFATALLLVWAARVIARRVARPVLAVAAAAHRVAGGDFEASAPVTTSDEVGRLARTFNDMAARVRTLVADLSRQVEETRRAVRTVEESKQLLQALVDNSTNLVAVVGPDGRFRLLNRRFADVFRLKPDAALGGVPGALLPREAALVFDAAVHAAMHGDAVIERDLVMATGGHRNDYHFIVFPLGGGAGATGLGVGMVGLDLTERVRAEDERRRLEAGVQQAQKLESLGLLAGGIAHDFNNILTAIVGGASMALLELPEGAPARGDLEQVVASAERAAKLTRQMLAYAGRASFAVEAFDLNVVIREMAELIQVSVPKQVRLVHDLVAPLPALRADRTQVSQIVLNLITNAAEATAERGGTVTIATRSRLRRGLELAEYRFLPGEAAGFVELTVSDDGVGMTPETQERIFDPFYSTKGSGRGLGLAAVLGIVKASGGTLKVASAPGAGTAVTVLFPAALDKAAPSRELTPATGEWQGTGTVLLVDDEAPLRRTTRRLLERAGFSVIEARDGLEGVEKFRDALGQVGAVILDVTMPVMGGAEAFQRIRAIAPAVPVLVSSGYDEQDTASAFTGGAVEFLQKPYRPEALLAALRKVRGVPA